MPPAARVTDMHTCPMFTGPVPHVGGPILPPGAPTVLIGFLPAARVTDMLVCVGPPDMIAKGSAGVFINFLPAARMGDLTAHGGVIVLGLPTVMIGEIGSPSPGAGGLGGVTAGLALAGLSNPINANPSVIATAQKRLEEMYQQAPAAKAQIDTVAKSVADACGGTVVTTAPKSRERALRKTLEEYDGNASKMKDLVRNTIVVPAGEEAAALDALRQAMRGRIQSEKIASVATDPCGYSGIIVSVVTDSGLVGEIQINSPEMIYAKEQLAVSRTILPPETFNALANDPNLPPGGLGHTLYEDWRTAPPGSAQRMEAAARSKAYYSSFRR